MGNSVDSVFLWRRYSPNIVDPITWCCWWLFCYSVWWWWLLFMEFNCYLLLLFYSDGDVEEWPISHSHCYYWFIYSDYISSFLLEILLMPVGDSFCSYSHCDPIPGGITIGGSACVAQCVGCLSVLCLSWWLCVSMCRTTPWPLRWFGGIVVVFAVSDVIIPYWSDDCSIRWWRYICWPVWWHCCYCDMKLFWYSIYTCQCVW